MATDYGELLSIKPKPVSMSKTYLPTWLTPFGFDSGWCSASVLSTLNPSDSVANCQQWCVVTSGCRAVGFRDQQGRPGECKVGARCSVWCL